MTTTLEDLERRVTVLEVKQRENTETLNWAAATLGKVSGVQDAHTKDLAELKAGQAELKATVGDLKTTVGGVAAKLDALTNNLPRMMAETIREVLAEQRKAEGK
jgi:uncharacterized coiled-coil protein SlyX